MKTYAEKLKDPRWQKKRLEVFERDNFTCQICNSKDETLNVHHKKYSKSGNPWDIYSKFLITYCEDCHKIVEDSKIEINKIFEDESEEFVFSQEEVLLGDCLQILETQVK